MGLVKTIYNVLGGFYMDYNSTFLIISVHKLNKSLTIFLCIFLPSSFILSQKYKNMHEKTEFFNSVFVFRVLLFALPDKKQLNTLYFILL